MSQPWWGKESLVETTPVGSGRAGALPRGTQRVGGPMSKEIDGRIAAFTPDWAPAPGDLDDAGLAFIPLFSEADGAGAPAAQPATAKGADRGAPDRGVAADARHAGLGAPGVHGAGHRAGLGVHPEGFPGGRPARPGAGATSLIFETEDDLFATPAQITQRQVQEGTMFRDLGPPDERLRAVPAVRRPRPGGPCVLPRAHGHRRRSRGSRSGSKSTRRAGLPPPVAVGGAAPLPVAPTPILSWEVYDGLSAQFVPATRRARTRPAAWCKEVWSCSVCPRPGGPGLPPGIDAPSGLFWLRLRIVQGKYERPPVLLDLRLNMVRALAADTIIDEPIDFGTDPTQRRTAAVEQGAGLARFGGRDRQRCGPFGRRATLSGKGHERPGHVRRPDATAVRARPRTGDLRFGDGVHGAAVPPGFRNVSVTYQAVSVRGGRHRGGRGERAPRVGPVRHGGEQPASGVGRLGRGESGRGRSARAAGACGAGRAVTEADFALLALQAPGARVARAQRHRRPAPGLLRPARSPGSSGVFVVPPDPGTGAPPVPTEEALRNVAKYLSQTAALAGVDVVAAPPRYRYVRARVAVVMAPRRTRRSTSSTRSRATCTRSRRGRRPGLALRPDAGVSPARALSSWSTSRAFWPCPSSSWRSTAAGSTRAPTSRSRTTRCSGRSGMSSSPTRKGVGHELQRRAPDIPAPRPLRRLDRRRNVPADSGNLTDWDRPGRHPTASLGRTGTKVVDAARGARRRCRPADWPCPCAPRDLAAAGPRRPGCSAATRAPTAGAWSVEFGAVFRRRPGERRPGRQPLAVRGRPAGPGPGLDRSRARSGSPRLAIPAPRGSPSCPGGDWLVATEPGAGPIALHRFGPAGDPKGEMEPLGGVRAHSTPRRGTTMAGSGSLRARPTMRPQLWSGVWSGDVQGRDHGRPAQGVPANRADGRRRKTGILPARDRRRRDRRHVVLVMVRRAAGTGIAPPTHDRPSSGVGLDRGRGIDSGISRCRWHRVRIDADVPPGTSLDVQVATADDGDRAATLDRNPTAAKPEINRAPRPMCRSLLPGRSIS